MKIAPFIVAGAVLIFDLGFIVGCFFTAFWPKTRKLPMPDQQEQ